MKTLRTIAAMALMMTIAVPTVQAGNPVSEKAKTNTTTATATATATTQQQKKTTTVFVTTRGKFYHKSSCLKLNLRRTKSMKTYEAEQKGYLPCKRCMGK